MCCSELACSAEKLDEVFGNQISGESPQPFLSRYNNNFEKSVDVDENQPPNRKLERLYPSLPSSLQRAQSGALRVQKKIPKNTGIDQEFERFGMRNEFQGHDGTAAKN